MQDLVIIGAGSFGEEMLDNLRLINEEEPRWNLLGFIDEEATGEFDGVPILGTLEDFLKMDKGIQYFVADLDGAVREKVMARCRMAGFTGATIFGLEYKPKENVTVGEGVYVGHRCALYPNSSVGDGVILEHGSSIYYGSSVGAYTTSRIYFMTGSSVKIGKHNVFSVRCTVNDYLRTADGCRFDTGSVLLEDAAEAGHYAGVPAKRVL